MDDFQESEANKQKQSQGAPVKILFIIGKGRSGSTLLDIALGELEGFFSMGEVFGGWVWESVSAVTEHMCGCGRRVEKCPVWSQVFSRALTRCMGDASQESLSEIRRSVLDVVRWRSVLRHLVRPSGLSNKDWPELDRFIQFAGQLYAAVFDVTGSRVLVDSSKWPAGPGPLGLVPGIVPYVVHLVRDPRAVSFSWQRSKRWSEGGEPMPVFGPTYSSASWMGRSMLGEWLARRRIPLTMRVRYEDFMREPRDTLEAIAGFVGEEVEGFPLADRHALALRENHTIMGNASRFESGSVRLRIDDEWKAQMSPFQRAWITLLTSPLLLRYGYPLRRESPRSEEQREQGPC